jgi:hypothetical protein
VDAGKRVKPSKTTAARIYIRSPKKRYLTINPKTVDESLRVPIVKPKKKSGTVKVLSAKTGIIAVPPGQAGKGRPTKTSKPLVNPKKLPPEPLVQLKCSFVRKKKISTAARNLPAKETGDKAGTKKRKSRSILPYDHQPRFEGGFRLVQGGLPELGKRR